MYFSREFLEEAHNQNTSVNNTRERLGSQKTENPNKGNGQREFQSASEGNAKSVTG